MDGKTSHHEGHDPERTRAGEHKGKKIIIFASIEQVQVQVSRPDEAIPLQAMRLLRKVRSQ